MARAWWRGSGSRIRADTFLDKREGLVEGQREELDSDRHWGRGWKQVEGPWQSHPPEPPSDRWECWGQREQVTYPGSLTGTAGAWPHMLPLVHCLSTRSTHASASEAVSYLKPTKTGGAASLLAMQKKPCGSPRLPSQSLDTPENWTISILL